MIAASTWLHSLATVIVLGHYVLLGLFYLPSLGQSLEAADMKRAVDGIESRMGLWIHLALLVFIATGIHLTLVDPKYEGLGNFTSPWALLMLVKHIFVFVFLVLGFYLEHGGRRNKLAEAGLARVQTIFRAMGACGVAILLLTAVAQTL